MNIVVLDGYTLNPGDLSWEGLRELGAVTVYDRTAQELVVQRSLDADILITNKTLLDASTIEGLPKLKYIGVLATGYNVVDLKAASQRDIPVTNIPSYSTKSVAQMVFAHLLNLTQHVAEHSATVFDRKWQNSPDFCYWDHPLTELDGLTMGIVGYGRIGKATADLARAFGMKILATSSDPNRREVTQEVEFISLEELFCRSDIVSLHCPLTKETEGLVDGTLLARMKKSAYIINTSRGGLINEQALAHALNTGQLAGAGLDVASREPILPDNPLLQARNCYITPHIAWATDAARRRLMNMAVENVRAFIAGEPVNVVNL